MPWHEVSARVFRTPQMGFGVSLRSSLARISGSLAFGRCGQMATARSCRVFCTRSQPEREWTNNARANSHIQCRGCRRIVLVPRLARVSLASEIQDLGQGPRIRGFCRDTATWPHRGNRNQSCSHVSLNVPTAHGCKSEASMRRCGSWLGCISRPGTP